MNKYILVVFSILTFVASTNSYAKKLENVFTVPSNQVSREKLLLSFVVPKQFRQLSVDETGYIPGMLKFLVEGYDEQTKSFIPANFQRNKLPPIIRIQTTVGKALTSAQFMSAVREKIHKELLTPPLYLEEYSQISPDYSHHDLALITGYNGQANVEVVFLRYYSDAHDLYGIQLSKTLPHNPRGALPSLSNARNELQVLKKFANKVVKVKSVGY